MSKKIEWLDNFAEKYAKEMKKTASKVEKQDLIVDRSVVKNSKVGDLVKFKGKLYRVADLDFVDEIGPGVILSEVGTEVPTSDPMSMAMGTQVTGLESKCTVAPEMARTNPGNIYDLGDIREQEVEEANEAAEQTVSDIANENMVNRTTVDGTFSNPTDVHEEVVTEESVEDILEETEEVVEETTEEVIEEVVEELTEEICEDCEDCEEEICEECEELIEEEVSKMENKTLAKVLKKAEMISKAIELEAEEILEDAELAVKETVPACDVTATLKYIEEKLEEEGIEALFQKKVSKVAMRKTAGEALTEKEMKELADLIVDEIVKEFEEILEEADEVCDEEVEVLEDQFEAEARLKSVLENKLANKGIHAKFARNKKPSASRAKEAMMARRAKRAKRAGK